MGLGEVHRLAEAAGHGTRVVRVATEGDGVPALVAPPAQERRVERDDGVDLEHAPALGGDAQRVAELLLERLRHEGAGRRGPGAHRIVHMSQDLEDLAARHEGATSAR